MSGGPSTTGKGSLRPWHHVLNGLPSYQHSKCAHAFPVLALTAFSLVGIGPEQ
jgi:hypothetical protein